MSRNSLLKTTLIAAAMSIGVHNLSFGSYSRYKRRRDDLPQDIQAERIRKAQEKRELKALKKDKR